MRTDIVEAVCQAANREFAPDLADAPGNIVDVLISAGYDPELVLVTCCSVAMLARAKETWLDGEIPPWPKGLDPELAHQLGVAPVAQIRGRWCFAYTDPEVALGATALGLPDHRVYLALPADLARFFEASPRMKDAFASSHTQIVPTIEDADSSDDAFVPQSEVYGEAVDDRPAAARLALPRTSNPDATMADAEAVDDDVSPDGDGADDDDDLELYVDRPTDLPPPKPKAAPAPRPPSDPTRLKPPAPTVMTATAKTGDTSPSMSRKQRPPTSQASQSSTSLKSRSSSSTTGSTKEGLKPAPWTPPPPPAVMATPIRSYLLAASVVIVVVGGGALIWKLQPRPLPPTKVTAVPVVDGQLDLMPAQRELLAQARAEPDPVMAIKTLSSSIRIDPNTVVARDAYLERAKRAATVGRWGQVRSDLARLTRRADLVEIKTAVDSLTAELEHQPKTPPPPSEPTP